MKIAKLGTQAIHNFRTHYIEVKIYLKGLSRYLPRELFSSLRIVFESISDKDTLAEEYFIPFGVFETDPELAVKAIDSFSRYFETMGGEIREVRKMIEHIETNEHMSKLLENVVILENNALGFIETAERVENEKEIAKLVNVNDILLPLIGVTKRIEEKQYFEMIVDLQEELRPVFGKALKLQQVFLNLISNADDAIRSKKGGNKRLSVSTKSEVDFVIVEISDTGIGIPEEHKDRIFEPYFSTKKTSGGTGLGLAYCKEIIEEHGGTIKVESEIGKGTTFIVKLPILKEPNLSKDARVSI